MLRRKKKTCELELGEEWGSSSSNNNNNNNNNNSIGRNGGNGGSSENGGCSGFHVVVSNGPNVPRDSAVRTLIRKQAMRGIGRERGKKARERERERETAAAGGDGGGGKANDVSGGSAVGAELRAERTPSWIFEEEEAEDHKGKEVYYSWIDCEEDFDFASSTEDVFGLAHHQRDARLQDAIFPDTLPLPQPILVSSAGYGAARSRFGIDLSMLDRLTSFSVGKPTIAQLAADLDKMVSLVLDPEPPERMRSYLAMVPGRYAESEVLAKVTDCLLARARLALMPGVENGVVAAGRSY